MFGYIRSLKLRNKILLSYIPIILVPVILFFAFTNRMVKHRFFDRLLYSADNSAQQTAEYLEQKISSLSGLLHMVVSEDLINGAFNADFDSMNIYDQYNLVCTLDDYFTNIDNQNDVDHMKIYLQDNFSFLNMTCTGSIGYLKRSEWYRRMVDDKKALLCVNEGKILEDSDSSFISIGKLVSSENNLKNYIGAFKIYVDEEKIKSVLEKNVLSSDGICYLQNEYGEIISCSDYDMLDKMRLSDKDFQTALKARQWTNVSLDSDDAVCSVREIEYSGWYMVNVMKNTLTTQETRSMTKMMIVYMIIVSLFSYLMAYFMAGSVNKRILRLNKSIEYAHNGEFKPIVTDARDLKSKDEIDILSENYNQMINRLDNAMEIQYENGKAIKNAELKILYEQLNPHFLYNVLDLINWMAINKENDNISRVVTMLARYYKLSLNKGNDILKLREEIEHVTLYFEMQKIRFENIKELNINVPENLLDCPVLKTIFQPLAENFIKHGLGGSEIVGVFSIKAEESGGDIIFTVSDNGVGIDAETIAEIKDGTYQSRSGSGFGLSSLNERLKIFYGEKYGLSFGDCSSGAVIYIKIPKQN